jgi:L-histidine N-alpha-methyltransferase
MHLVSRVRQGVRIPAASFATSFEPGDWIWTESSYKFTRESTETMLAEAGLAIDTWYTDAEGRFGLVLARPGDSRGGRRRRSSATTGTR